jgi:hypothetical protein
MTTTEPSLSHRRSEAPGPARRAAPAIGAWLPTWDLITTKYREIRKRRGLMITVAVLIVAPTVLIDGLRLLFHAADPHSYALAGDPGIFSQLSNLMAEFGFIAAAALGAGAATTDLTDGMLRHLVITGRSRVALYLARIPAGLAVTVPLVALAFAMNCLVTSYESPPPPTSVHMNGLTLPEHLNQAGLQTWLLLAINPSGHRQDTCFRGLVTLLAEALGKTPSSLVALANSAQSIARLPADRAHRAFRLAWCRAGR